MLLNELADVADRDLRIRGGIFEIQLDRAAENPAAEIDLLDRELRHLPVGVAARCDRPRDIGCNPHFDRALGVRPFGTEQKTAGEPPHPPSRGQRCASPKQPAAVDPLGLLQA